MIVRSKIGNVKLADAIDDLIETDVIPDYNEELDFETLKILSEYEMESTMNSVQTNMSLGQLAVGSENDFSAIFTEQGSSSIATMSYMNDLLTVTFRTNQQTEYSYAVPEATLKQIRDEVNATLIDGEGSVGRLMNNLINNKTIKLI